MAAPRVEVEIAGKATGFAAEFRKISAAATQAGNKIKSAFSGIQGAAAALGVGLSVAGFAAFVKGAVDAADKLNDLSKVTSVGAVQLGGIGFAAQQAGTDLEGVAKAFGKLNLNIADAQAGNADAVDTFRKLGISINDLRSLKGEEIFVKLADTFASYEDGANKVAGANRVFGKTFASVLPLLDEGGESLRKNIAYFERYGGVTDDLVRSSDQFNDSLTKLGLLNRAFANQLAAALLPSMQRLVEYLVDAKEKGDGFKGAAEDISAGLKVVAKFAIASAFALKDFGEFLGSVAAQAQALGKLQYARVAEIGDEFDAKMEKSKQRLLEYKKIFDAAGGGSDGFHRSGVKFPPSRRTAPNFGNPGAGTGSAAKSQVDDFARALERVSKLAADADLELAGMFSTQEITGAQKALAALTSSDEWKKFTQPQQAELTARLQAIDAIQRETLEWKKKNDEQEKSIKLYQDIEQAQQQAAQAFTANLGQYADDNDILARQIGLIGEEDLARQKLAETIEFERRKRKALLADDDPAAAATRIAMLETEFQKRIKLLEALDAEAQKFNEVQQYNQIFADNFAASVTDVVNGTKSISEAFKDMAKSIADAITRIAAQKLAESIFGGKDGIGNIFTSLFGSGNTGGSAGFDFSKIFASIFGGASVPAFAGGTDYVPRTGLALVHQGERITPAAQNWRGSGDRVVNNTTVQLQVMPGANYQTARQAAKMAADRATFARRRG